MRSSRWLVTLGIVMGFAVGCSSNTDEEQSPVPEEDTQIVPPGKEDNFLSATAQEYMVEGISTVTIESNLANASEERKLARVYELIPLKQIVIG